MTSVIHTIELHAGETAYWVEFVRDAVGKWHAQVLLPDASKWGFRQEENGPFHPCELHAERLVFVALDRRNSGRAA